MLILLPQEVEYCQIISPKSTKKTTQVGLKYHGYLFIKVKSYSLAQSHNAILSCREILERPPFSRLPILLKEPSAYSLWFETKSSIVVT